MSHNQKALLSAIALYLLLILLAWKLLSGNTPAHPTKNKPVPVTLSMFQPSPSSAPANNMATQPAPQKTTPNKLEPKPVPKPKKIKKVHQSKPKAKRPTQPPQKQPLKKQTKKKVVKKTAKPKPAVVHKPVQTPTIKKVKKASSPTASQPPKPSSAPSSTPTKKVTAPSPPAKPGLTQQQRHAIEQRYLTELSQTLARYAQQNYPYRARRRHQQGKVLLSFTLHPDGYISHIQIKSSSGHRLLDQAALAIVNEQMHRYFKPFPKALPKQPKNIAVPIQYSLQ